MSNLDFAFHPSKPLPPMVLQDKLGARQVPYPAGTSMLDEYAMAIAPSVSLMRASFNGNMDLWANEVWGLALALLANRPTEKQVKALDAATATDEKPSRIKLVNGAE